MERANQSNEAFEVTPCLGAGVVVGVSVRRSSLAQDPFPSFGNETTHGSAVVDRSIQALETFLDVRKGALRTVRQVHGDNIVCLRSNDTRDIASVEADAIVSNDAHDVLGIKVADCCAVLLYDPVRRVIAACHSGWRGTAKGIAAATVRAMEQEYGVQAADVRAWLSPCASGQRYRVDTDVADLFPRSRLPLDDGGWLFDNAGEIRLQLLDAGLLLVARDGRCTMDDGRFHSFRLQGSQAGRTLAFIKLLGVGEPAGTELVNANELTR